MQSTWKQANIIIGARADGVLRNHSAMVHTREPSFSRLHLLPKKAKKLICAAANNRRIHHSAMVPMQNCLNKHAHQ